MKKYLKYLCLIIFILNIAVIIVESLMPGTASASQSDAVTDKVVDIIDVITPPKEEKIIYPTSIQISGDDSIYLGESKKLNLLFTPSDVNYKNVVWESSNSEIISINANGIITGLQEGKAIILVFSKDHTEVTNQFEVEVVKKPFVQLTDFKITGQKTVYLNENKTTTSKLNIVTTPTNATIDKITWKSENTDIATINNQGLVRAISTGTALINATIQSGSNTYKKSLEITVENIQIVEINSIEILSDSSCYVGRTIALQANIEPMEDVATGKYLDSTVKWTVDKEDIATIDENGNLIGHKVGTVKVTVTSEYDSSKTTSVDVEIIPVLIETVEISLDTTKLIVGESIQISYEINPVDATNKTLHFQTDTNCLTIDNDGFVFANKAGTGIIKITDDEGNVYQEIKFEISKKPLFTEESLQNLRHFVRKSVGHFGAFFTMGTFGFLTFYFFLKKKKIGIFLSCIIGVSVAIISELCQKITVGRYCTVNDMIIDSIGYLSATLFLIIIFLIIWLIKRRKTKTIKEE